MIDPTRTALLVMDYQTGILGMLGDDANAFVDRAAGAIAAMRAAGGTVGYVRVAFTDADVIPETAAMGKTIGDRRAAFGADAPATQIDPRVAPQDGDIVVRKVRVGPFGTTDLDAQLRARGVDTLVLAGVSTSGVVLSAVRDGADRDYRLLVLEDGCADRDAEVHAFLTERIFPRQAEVISTAAFVAQLEGASPR